MPSINISQEDFDTVASAALDARDAGADIEARRLDKLARKINAALTSQSVNQAVGGAHMRKTANPSWRDAPSVLTGKTG